MNSVRSYRTAVALLLVFTAVAILCVLFGVPSSAPDCHGEGGCTLYIPKAGSAAVRTDLNTAGFISLSMLPHVSAFATEIISMREQLGGFSSTEQLMQINGIGLKTFLKVAPYVKCENVFEAPQTEITR